METLEKILNHLSNSDPITRLITLRFSGNKKFDFVELTDNKGARGITVQNLGQHDIFVGSARIKVTPGNSYSILMPFRIINNEFDVSFGDINPSAPDKTAPMKDAVLNYLVDVEQEC